MINLAGIEFTWSERSLLAATAGFLLILALISSQVNRRASHDVMNTVQNMHSWTASRLGGVAVFCALVSVAWLLPESFADRYRWFLVPLGLLFVTGLLEDIYFGISAVVRLLITFGASLITIALFGVWLNRVGILWLDWLFEYWYFGIPFTLLVTSAVTHGFNLIDGVNGLSSLVAGAAALGLAKIGHEADYFEMVEFATMLLAIVLGFFVVNYPMGVVFLGDSGAYCLGFTLAWCAVSILSSAPDASPWALLLVLFWPLADTALAVFRRVSKGVGVFQPDRMHFHQLVLRGLEIHAFGLANRRLVNPLVTLTLAPFVLAPPIVGVLFWDNDLGAGVSTLAFIFLFALSYHGVKRYVVNLDRRKRP